MVNARLLRDTSARRLAPESMDMDRALIKSNENHIDGDDRELIKSNENHMDCRRSLVKSNENEIDSTGGRRAETKK